MSDKNILLFAPFGAWTVHHQLDAVVGAALRLRGCRVQALCCDGVFKECYIAGQPYNPASCAACQKQSKQLFQAFGIPIMQIRQFIAAEDQRECEAWSATIAPDRFATAAFNGLPVGRWVALGVIAKLKRNEYDTSDPEVVKTIRQFLYNGALLIKAFQRCIREFDPGHVINYSGDHVYYRVVFELCRQNKINILTHERGQTDDSFTLLNNVTMSSAWSTGLEEWRQWQHVPLSRHQFATIQTHIEGLEQSKNNNFQKLYNTRSDYRIFKAQLRIPSDAKVVALFSSNEWELGSYRATSGMQLIFENQAAWIRRTAEICAKNNWYLVVRHHPICAGTATYPRDSNLIAQMTDLNRDFGSHVRVIMPAEKLSSYALVWNADAAVTIYSTIGMESFMRGVGAVHLADTIYKPMGLDVVKSIEAYEPAIAQAIEHTQSFNMEHLRNAYRFAYFRFFTAYSHRFKSFGIKETYLPDIRIRCIDELSPGNDPVLDRVCDHIMHGGPLYALPEQKDFREEESECIKIEYDKIVRQKNEIRHYQCTQHKTPEPLVAVVRVRQNGIRTQQAEPFHSGTRRSWHQNLKILQVPQVASQGARPFLESLLDTVGRSEAEYVYIASDNTQMNESLIATCADYLGAPENTHIGVVIFGCYLIGREGELRDEAMTSLRPTASFDALVQASAAFTNPPDLFALYFMRRAFCLDLLTYLLSEAVGPSLPELARRIFDKIAANPSALHRLRYPFITVYESSSDQEKLKKALALIRKEQNDSALQVLDVLKVEGGATAAVQYARAVAKCKVDRLVEGRLAMESILLASQAPDAMWQFYDSILLELSRRPYDYASIARAVESIEGYLEPGQEAFLFNTVRSLPENAAILEIGGYYGRSTAAMAFACVGTKRHVYTIDTFYGNDGPMGRCDSFLDVWRANLSRLDLEGYATPLQGLSSQQLATLEKSNQFDFVFVDGSHEYADIIKDLELVYPLVKEGGWIALHDVEPGWPGPWRVWRQTAMPLLSDHAYVSTLACGRKKIDTPYSANDSAAFSYAENWATYIAETFPKLNVLTHAMRVTAKALKQMACASRQERSELQNARLIIANMPNPIKQTMRTMLEKEAVTDGLLHYWNSLTLQREGNVTEAETAFGKAQTHSGIDLATILAA